MHVFERGSENSAIEEIGLYRDHSWDVVGGTPSEADDVPTFRREMLGQAVTYDSGRADDERCLVVVHGFHHRSHFDGDKGGAMVFSVAAEETMADVGEIEVFVAVARAGSFTVAARELGSSKSNVGKAVQRLEASLGTRLFQRTTRSVRLTEDGETYLAAAESALDGLREAEHALAARRSEPSGTVRLALPSGLGRLILPTLPTLRDRHSRISFDVGLDDRMSDPVGEGWDIVVRIGERPAAGELLVRALCSLRLGLYASPAYLKRRGVPRALAELDAHEAIVFRGPTGRLRPWRVADDEKERELSPKAALVLADGQALVDAAVAGAGIAQIHDRVAAPYLQQRTLEQVLPETEVAGPNVYAIVALGRRMPPKTRAVLQHLVETLRSPAASGAKGPLR